MPLIKTIKKIARKLLFRVPSSAVVIFHHITDAPECQKSKCVLPFAKFTGFIESYRNYDSLPSVLKNPARKKIAITFDDGLQDVYTLAYPYLKEKNIPFTVFIVTDFLDQPGYITTENLKELAKDDLVTIGAHGTTHQNLNLLSPGQQKSELEDSQKILEAKTGAGVTLFAFSHGAYDKNTLKQMGKYKYGFTTKQLPLNFLTKVRKKRIPRYNVDAASVDAVAAELNKFLKGQK